MAETDACSMPTNHHKLPAMHKGLQPRWQHVQDRVVAMLHWMLSGEQPRAGRSLVTGLTWRACRSKGGTFDMLLLDAVVEKCGPARGKNRRMGALRPASRPRRRP